MQNVGVIMINKTKWICQYGVCSCCILRLFLD